MNPAVLSDQSSYYITFMASFVIWFMFLGLIVLWVIDGKLKKEQALHAFLAVLLAWLIAEVLKSLIPTQRPFTINGRLPLTFTLVTSNSNSFPSSHTAVAVALAFSVWLHNKKNGLIFVIGAILVAAGRVLSNVHFVLDVAAGGFIGLTTAVILERIHVTKLIK